MRDEQQRDQRVCGEILGGLPARRLLATQKGATAVGQQRIGDVVKHIDGVVTLGAGGGLLDALEHG